MICTSCFSNKGIELRKISIAIGNPRGFKGENATELKPTWPMVKRGYGYDEYVKLLEERKIDPAEVVKKYEGGVFLCWEKEPEKCHRSFLAKWLKEHTGEEINEIGKEKKAEQLKML